MVYRRHLLPVSVLALLALLITLIPVYPNDLWWHVRSGEEIVRHGRIPTHDTYSFTGWGRPFVYSGWASQALLYLLESVGGAPLLVITRNVVITAAYTLVLIGAAKRSGSWTIAALATLWSGLFSIEFWHIRPQIFGYLPFAALLYVLLGFSDGWLRGRWLVVVPLATALWTHLHGGFTIAPLVAVLVAGAATLEAGVHRELPQATRRIGLLWLTALSTGVAMLINPWGVGISSAVRSLLTDQAIQMFVVEWQPPHPGSIFRNLFYGSILLTTAAFAISRRRATLPELLVFAGLLWQAWTASRFIIWYGLAWPLLVAPALAGSFPVRYRRRPTLEIGIFNVAIALVLVALPLSQQPTSPFRRLLPDAYRNMLIADPGGEPLIINSTPVNAVAYLAAHPLPANARLFNETGAGSYLIWAWRDGLVFVDPRYTTQPLQVWLDYRQISAGCEYNTLLDRYGITHALVDHQLQSGLAEALAVDTSWRKLWGNEMTTLYERTSAAAEDPLCQAASPSS